MVRAGGGGRAQRSSRQAAPDSAGQASHCSSASRPTAQASGAATHRLTQWKQSSRRPHEPSPSAARSRAIASQGPSSCASSVDNRQVANTASTTCNQTLSTASHR